MRAHRIDFNYDYLGIPQMAALGIFREINKMIRVILALTMLTLSGCASLPENYSQLTTEQFLQGVANNNKPKIIPAKYIKGSEASLSMIGASYNVVGSYGSGIVLDGIRETAKLCSDKGLVVKNPSVINSRKVLTCGTNDLKVLAIHYVSRENAGYDTGHTYAYFDHLALFDIDKKLSEKDIEWIANQYISFENQTVDFEHAHNHQKLDSKEFSNFISLYIN
ncbi:hypothetical protein ABMY48_10350 [Pseudoalteromonas sp. XMcav2-N-2]